ncbi:ZIP family metal transporter, partial [Frisingicoccus sp.]|uniref:ZIP family metal transporter n=1 Tax=Frisingicoccus sp. TaxID=1918627 RepID=UPI003FA53D37
MMTQSLIWAALGTGFAFLMTVSGAATVFLFRKKVNEGFQKIFLGFASGIMMAASVWSLIIPAIEQAKLAGGLPWIPAAAGFLAGGLFLMAVDSLFDRYRRSKNPSGLLVFAVTLHNIP